jgi:hypothetical protein
MYADGTKWTSSGCDVGTGALGSISFEKFVSAPKAPFVSMRAVSWVCNFKSLILLGLGTSVTPAIIIFPKVLNSTEDAHLKTMSTFETMSIFVVGMP